MSDLTDHTALGHLLRAGRSTRVHLPQRFFQVSNIHDFADPPPAARVIRNRTSNPPHPAN